MKRIFEKALSIFLCLPLLCGFFAFFGASKAEAASGTAVAENIIGGILDYEMKSTGASSVQKLLNGPFASGAGVSSDWFVLALRQYKGNYDFSAYASKLKDYLKSDAPSGAVAAQRCALMLLAVGEQDSFVQKTADSAIGDMGVMSYVFGLHLLNNGCKSAAASVSSVIGSLLSAQLSDGGWAESGQHGDVDVTAMALQALAPYVKSNTKVHTATERALAFLSKKQLSDGGFSSYGAENAESCAQVLTVLGALNIDARSEKSFLKNGKSVLDALKSFRLGDGSFSHFSGGKTNTSATAQALYALVAFYRQQNGQGSLYLFSKSVAFSGQAVAKAQPKVAAGKISNESSTAKTGTAGSSDEADAASVANGETAENTAAVSNPAGEDTTALVGSKAKQTFLKRVGTFFGRFSYRLWVCLAIAFIALVLCLGFWVSGRQKKGTYLVVIGVAFLLAVAVFCSDVQSKQSFFAPTTTNAAVTGSSSVEPVVTVTFTIRCDTVVGKKGKAKVPADGVILASQGFSLPNGSSVYDLLLAAEKKDKIRVESKTQSGSPYIEAIDSIRESDYGALSGWIYTVNGQTPAMGCDDYKIENGDKIAFLYTVNGGVDVR